MSDYKSGRAVVLGLLLLAMPLALVARLLQPRFVLEPRAPEKPRTLALLPFENLSGDPDLELLAAELDRALEQSLAESGFELLVHDAAWVHAGSERGIERIADELRADYVVAGSVEAKGGTLDVDAYLFRASGDKGFWAERMSFEGSERASVPGDVARRIGAALRY